MKNLMAILLLSLAPLFATAEDHGRHGNHYRFSSIGLDVFNANNLVIKIDGISYFADRGLLELNRLRPGKHYVEIYREQRQGRYGRVQLVYDGFFRILPGEYRYGVVRPNGQLVWKNVNRNCNRQPVYRTPQGYDKSRTSRYQCRR